MFRNSPNTETFQKYTTPSPAHVKSRYSTKKKDVITCWEISTPTTNYHRNWAWVREYVITTMGSQTVMMNVELMQALKINPFQNSLCNASGNTRDTWVRCVLCIEWLEKIIYFQNRPDPDVESVACCIG